MRCPECGGNAHKTGHYATGGKHGSDSYECDECGHEWTEECDD